MGEKQEKNIASMSISVHDPLCISGSDNPNQLLVSEPLTVKNFLNWSRAVKISLGAKNKMCFIDGTPPPSDITSSEFMIWKRADLMVLSWLLNSISKELIVGFNSANTSRQLWIRVEKHYGQFNMTVIYQIQKELFNITQGDVSVTEYYGKLNVLWFNMDELLSIVKCDQCDSIICCDKCKSPILATTLLGVTRLTQFLKGLHEKYDAIRNQILVMDPVPTVEKAYGMLLNVEEKENINEISTNTLLNGAMLTQKVSSSAYTNNKQWKDPKGRFCTICKKEGHMKDTCFTITGVQPWYLKYREDQGRPWKPKEKAQLVDTPIDEAKTGMHINSNAFSVTHLQQIVQEEVQKTVNKSSEHVNLADLGEFSVSHRSINGEICPHLKLARRKLLVLDINGLLADIVMPAPKGCRGDIHISRRAVFKRPFCEEFLNFCFQNFEIGIWSSRSKKVIDRVVDYLLGNLKEKLVFCWNLQHSTQTGFRTLDNKYKSLVCKELKKIWEKDDPELPWTKGDYDESNTLLLDDSPYKALLNPLHTAIFPHAYSYLDKSDNSLGRGGSIRVYVEGLLGCENVQKYVEKNPFGQRAIDEQDESWKFYSEILHKMNTLLEEDSNTEELCSSESPGKQKG